MSSPSQFCRALYLLNNTDNAVMIAWASMHRFIAGDTDDYAILIRPQWSIQDLMDDETRSSNAVLL